MKAKVAEVFKSIQGEGIYQAKMQVFIRFFGCNLHCSFCDTHPASYQQLTVSELLDMVLSYSDYHSISLTGGEPLLWAGYLKELLKELKNAGKITYLETNGLLTDSLREVIDFVDIIAMDFKLPSAAKTGNLWGKHRSFFKVAVSSGKKVFVKVVVTEDARDEDIFQAAKIIKEAKKKVPFILQLAHPNEEKARPLALRFQKILFPDIEAKIMIQLHKLLGVK